MWYLTAPEVIDICQQETGEAQLRDFNLLDSALTRPKNYAAYEEGDPDIYVAAAHLLYGLACNHPFVDGNKRVALKATGVFLLFNGYRITGDDADVYHLVMDVADEHLDIAQIAAQLQILTEELELPDE